MKYVSNLPSVLISRWLGSVSLLAGVILLVVTVGPAQLTGNWIVWLALAGILVGIVLQQTRQHAIDVFISQLEQSIQNCAEGGTENCELQAVKGIQSTATIADNVNTTAKTLYTSNFLISDVSGNLGLHANSISETARNILQESQRQIEMISMVHGLVGGLQSVFQHAAQTADKTVELAEKSESEGNSGKVIMTSAMTNVSNLSESVKETGIMIDQLGQNSEEIGGIINVIKGVAEQTNLLALNAAIEAARAGEQGRGLAVVADEVRTLAGKTQSYASDIEVIIEKLMRDIELASNKVKEGVSIASESDEAIENVVISYSELVGYMLDINKMANELSDGVNLEIHSAESIYSMLENVKKIGASTEEGIRQLDSASMELANLGQQLKVMASTKQENQDVINDTELF